MQENKYLIDIESSTETARLFLQDRLLTQTMGGVFPHDFDLSQTKRILDIACGPGGWALEVAFQYPEIDVVGIDLSQTMVRYAQAQAKVQRLGNAEFQVMDVRKQLHFPDASFDLVNMRYLFSIMESNLWTSLLAECHRLLRPGGRVRWTETEPRGGSNSPAYEEIVLLITKTLAKRNLTFFSDGSWIGLTPHMGKLLRDAGFVILDKRAYLHEASSGTEAFQTTCEDIVVGVELTKPAILKAGIASENKLEELQAQLQEQFQSPDFCYISSLHCWLAEKPHSDEGP